MKGEKKSCATFNLFSSSFLEISSQISLSTLRCCTIEMCYSAGDAAVDDI